MRRPDLTAWTVILFALPLVRCAVGADIEPSKLARGGNTAGATPSFGGASGGSGGSRLGNGGAPFVSGGMSAGSSAKGGAGSGASAGAGSSSQGGSNGGSSGGVGGANGYAGAGGATAGALGGASTSAQGGASGGASGGGGSGGSVGAAGKAAGGNCSAGKCGTPTHCAYAWRDSAACAPACLGRTQGDQLKCANVLDCYVEHDCGPATCGGNDQTCGANKLGFGTAAYPYAQQVYDCLCKA